MSSHSESGSNGEMPETCFCDAQRQRLASLIDHAAASRETAELARVRYREGAVDFLRLLDAERTLLQAEDALAAETKRI